MFYVGEYDNIEQVQSDTGKKNEKFANTFRQFKYWIEIGGETVSQAPKPTQTAAKPATQKQTPKPAAQQPGKLWASIPSIQANPPSKGQTKMYVNYTLTSNTDNLRRRLFVWDVNGQKYILNPANGQQLLAEKTGAVGGESQQLVLDLSKLPAASPSKPFRFTICVFVNDPTLKQELAKKFLGVYHWDGSRVTYHPGS
ncbi:MAG: hypothetical protein K2M06_00080 [Muribaculaceae bacterium]|nr:hypothetical protein [Muribaculaceae bacterium]